LDHTWYTLTPGIVLAYPCHRITHSEGSTPLELERRNSAMTQAQQALTAIKAYVASRPSEDSRAHRRKVWEAVIQGAEGYDEEATAKSDPSEKNEEAVFADGSRLWWNHALSAWEVGPEAALEPSDDAATHARLPA
jgi:hypothetical protein